MISYSIRVGSTQPGQIKSQIKETKAYGVAQADEIINITNFARHITTHGCVYSKADIVAVLSLAVTCIRELLLDGKKVKLGEFGDFSVSLNTTGAVDTASFTADNIKRVDVVFTPGEDLKNLRKDATFKLVPTRRKQAVAIEEIKNEQTIKGLE